MINFLIEFILMLIVGGIFINGIYIITRGWIVELPDGTKKREGMIFGFIETHFEKVIGYNKIFYTAEKLSEKYAELQYLKKELSDKISFQNGDTFFCIKDGIDLTSEQCLQIERLLACKGKYYENKIELYIDKPIYKYPEFVRMPVEKCIKCMASLYGIFLWSLFYLYAKNDFNILVFFFGGFVYIVCLAYINNIFFKKNG